VHSSTLVTAGLVVTILYGDVFTHKWALLFLIVRGTVTMVVGSCCALFEVRIKKVVAYSTLSQMGLGILTFGLGNFYVGLLNLVSHGFAKRLLFIQIGYLIHINSGQQNVRA